MLTYLLRNIGYLCLLAWLAACTPQLEEKLSITFTGDVLLDRGVRQEIQKKGLRALFTSVAPVFLASDATVINLECPFTATPSPLNKKYIFRADPIWAKILSETGITHAAMANNHTIDQGRSGLTETYNHLLSANIIPLGYGKTPADGCCPILIEKGKIKVGLFNSVILPLENWVFLENKPGICQRPIEDLEREIKKFKKQHPQSYAVIILHWGVEYQPSPTFSQRKDAHRLIEAGADAIIGHHPHVIQKNEEINGKPVFYSLGNFVFDQRKPATSKGMMVQLHFTLQGISTTLFPVMIKDCRPELQKDY